MRCGEGVHLCAGPANIEIAPAIGGALAAYWSETDQGPLHWLRPLPDKAREDGDVLAAAGFPLVPFSNRVRAGRFSFDGQAVSLALNFADHPHAIHGHGWQSPWTVEAAEADRARIFYRHTADAWPWDYSARQHFTLTPDALTVTLEVTNESARAMPVGLGFHPYFPRTPQTVVTAQVDKIWQVDDEVMPLALETPDDDDNPTRGLRADAVALDNCFTGWSRRATIAWPERRAALIMTASEALDHVVVFTPPGADFLCVEPVSHSTDAFNMADAGAADTGMQVLSPGQSLSVSMTLEPQFQPA